MNTTKQLTAALAVVAFLFGSIGPAWADGKGRGRGLQHPKVLPPNATAYGKTYGDWAAEWWKWAYSLPHTPEEQDHPLFDSTGDNCAIGQAGPVWFLAGTFDTSIDDGDVIRGEAVRSCEIPKGTSLFFPILNVSCTSLTGDDAPLQDCASSFNHGITDLELVIDGRKVRNVDKLRGNSRLFTFWVPENNISEIEGNQTGAAATDGIYAFVKPLSPGNHTIRFAGAFVFTAEEDGFDFEFRLDITYHLTVVGGHGGKDDDDDDD